MEKQTPGSNLIPSQFLHFHSSGTKLPYQFHRLDRENLVGSAEELEWNWGNSVGIGTEPGCLFPHLPSTLTPISHFDLTFFGAKSSLKEGRP